MVCIDKFLGKRVRVPEDRRYYSKLGLWAKPDGQDLVFGFSEPALVLMGGLNDFEPLVADGQKVEKGETVLFAITGKILYLDAPIKGSILFHPEIKKQPAIMAQDPYERSWLFKIKPDEDLKGAYQSLDAAQSYAESLKASEGAKNPEGLKGGVSGMCKAVYGGIREQKL
jgi:glycine cleavage system H lipoate-binding protein